jgi:hypothetical protein
MPTNQLEKLSPEEIRRRSSYTLKDGELGQRYKIFDEKYDSRGSETVEDLTEVTTQEAGSA